MINQISPLPVSCLIVHQANSSADIFCAGRDGFFA